VQTGQRLTSNTPNAIRLRKRRAANPEKVRAEGKKWKAANPEKHRASTRKWGAANPHARIFAAKKSYARKAKVPFTLIFEDMVWPTHCPALGTKLEYVAGFNGRGNRSPEITPSFDRIDPALGYTPQNTVIISLLANRIKTDATHDQIRKVSEWLGRVAWENPA